ncbi:MAG: phage holin family protein [Bacteroidetes bacterium]|nr:phage holin family protein [Bacteroidota bacterium]
MFEPGKIDELMASLRSYINTNIELLKLEATERISIIGAGIISSLVLTVIGIFFIFFISFGAAFYLSAILGDNYSGFVMVAGFYLLVLLILLIGRKSLLKKPICDKIIQRIFNKNQ